MNSREPPPPADGRGASKVDALLESCRPLTTLSPVVHTRIKRRLGRSLSGWKGRRAGWLKPAVLTCTLLLCGVASGLALDRIVLRHSADTLDVTSAASAPASRRPGKGKAAPHRSPPPVPLSPQTEVTEDPGSRPASSSAPAEATLGEPLVLPLRAPKRRMAISRSSLTQDAPHSSPPLDPGLQASSTLAGSSPVPAAIPAPPPPLIGVPAIATAKVAIAAPVPVVAPGFAPGAAVPPPPSPSAQAQPAQEARPSEERMLAVAVRALRSQNDPGSALVALDEYQSRYPQGQLSVEAKALRASTLIALDRRDEALRVLDRLNLEQVPGGFQRQLQRAELRSAFGRPLEFISLNRTFSG